LQERIDAEQLNTTEANTGGDRYVNMRVTIDSLLSYHVTRNDYTVGSSSRRDPDMEKEASPRWAELAIPRVGT
jgi:hypothetical protein